MSSPDRKPLHFVASSIKDLRGLPEEVKDVFGAGLLDAQYGEHPEGARPFGEGLPREVMKLVEDYDGNTYRAAYTVALSHAVYVLHVFTKKSKRGIETPRPDKDTIRSRLQAAKEHHKRFYEER
ncbi:MAG: type II toxin-antitoxin system RelE/ParE family toxin [Vicinamibacterales bacterium]